VADPVSERCLRVNDRSLDAPDDHRVAGLAVHVHAIRRHQRIDLSRPESAIERCRLEHFATCARDAWWHGDGIGPKPARRVAVRWSNDLLPGDGEVPITQRGPAYASRKIQGFDEEIYCALRWHRLRYLGADDTDFRRPTEG